MRQRVTTSSQPTRSPHRRGQDPKPTLQCGFATSAVEARQDSYSHGRYCSGDIYVLGNLGIAHVVALTTGTPSMNLSPQEDGIAAGGSLLFSQRAFGSSFCASVPLPH